MRLALLAAALLILNGCATPMSFFVTSSGPGQGGDLGGIEGADKYCQQLASAVGAGDRTWHAYLSTQGKVLGDPNVVHARDRIGSGPWYNAKGGLIAWSVEGLHDGGNHITTQTALDERGQLVNTRAQNPPKHDILTGSRPDGTGYGGGRTTVGVGGELPDMTCGNWTKNTPDGSAMVGHHDRAGPIDHPWATSWNSSHGSYGCTQEKLRASGGEGLFYCFAVNK